MKKRVEREDNYSSESEYKETGCAGNSQLHNGKGRPRNKQDSENRKWSYNWKINV